MDQFAVCFSVNLYDGVRRDVSCPGGREIKREKKYIVGFKQTMSTMSAAKKKMSFLKKAGKCKSNSNM